MTDTPLKPCPWCGGNAEIIGQKFPSIGIRYNVTCRGDCGTILDCREVHIRDAALAWNRRPAQTYTQDQLDAAVRAERERCAQIAEGPTGSGVPCPYGNDKPGDPTWNHTDKDICPVCKKDGEGSLYACHDNIGPRIAAAIREGE